MSIVNPSQSSPGDTIDASDINNPVNQLAAVVNGNIDSTNLAANAVTTAAVANGAVTAAKVATGATIPAVMQNPYKFSAWASVATAIAAGFVPTKITFGTKEYDTGSNFDAVTNNRFTAPVAGFYQFSALMQSGSGAANEFYNIFLYKNGTLFKSGTGHNSTTAGTVLESVSPPPFQLAANDYIEVWAAQNSAGAKNTVTGADKTYFGGYLVSAT